MFEIEKSQRFNDGEKMLYNIMLLLEQINKALVSNEKEESKEEDKAVGNVTNNNIKQGKRR